MRPILIPARARARRADWAPGPGVLVPLPAETSLVTCPSGFNFEGEHTASSTNLDVKSVDTKLLAANSDVLSSQHGSVGGGLITIGFDLHTTGDTNDCLAATRKSCQFPAPNCFDRVVFLHEPQIGDVDESIVERGEDTSNAKDELA
jgi:hypothetical protein